IPLSGGVIIAANHFSYLDIPLLSYGLNRPANFVGKKQLFTIPIVGTLLRLLGGIPIDREKIDRSALREIMKKLNSGNVVVIYPEGTRSHDGRLQPGKPGVGFIVRMSGKKVVPTAILGTDKAMPSGSWFMRPHPVTIRFGEPLDFSGNPQKSEKQGLDSQISQEIMAKIAALFETG
ncbi:MAG TPA: lysophospholipid acyltransferase family protein, partial [Nitrospirota bacterium]|nr:lysophospholipid acyltransferase family protein [Nitrospirota bacterium]